MPMSFPWALGFPSFLDGSSTLPPSAFPGEPTQEEDADEQEEAADHCYLILHCEHECLRSCTCFCELWEVCGGDGAGSLTLRKGVSASFRFFTGQKLMVFSFIYTREPGLSPRRLPTYHLADAGSRTSL